VWQGEDNMRVRHRQQIARTRLDPAVPRIGLTPRAMPVATGNGVNPITCLMGSFLFWGVRPANRRCVKA
jgi:hypothetical protein